MKLRRPGTEAAVRNPPQAAGTNGKRASEVVGELPALPRTTSGPSSQSSPSGGHDADLRRLLEEVQSAIEALPGRIAKVAGDAMRQQHKVNKQELADVWVAVHAEAEQLKKLRTKERANPQFVVDQLDARFQWLVSQLSERFVAVGNELVRIEQLVSETGRGPTPSNGPAEPAGPPNPAGAGPSATTKP